MLRSVEHFACDPVLCLPDRRGGLDIHDNRVLQIYLVVGRVEEVRLAAICSGPPRGRINRLKLSRIHVGRGAKVGSVQLFQILRRR